MRRVCAARSSMSKSPRSMKFSSRALACGWAFHLVPLASQKGDSADLLAYLPMGLSLFVTFVLCNFTESDRKGRFDGFPSRLFTLPVATRTLVLAPMLFSILTVAVVYVAWTTLALPALG